LIEAQGSAVESTNSIATAKGWLGAASFWIPSHSPVSAWREHAPFSFWLVDALSPRSIVELGTHWGYSFFVFCEAVRRLGLDSTVYALDSWEGDTHAGLYGEEVFEYVTKVSQDEYANFSRLVRGYFDESLEQFLDGTIDLLHIDGRHGYEDVRHDFEAWRPKLSDRAVVLFHDTHEHENGFGVWKFWAEVAGEYPSFEFQHEHGLGVLGVGRNLAPAVREFFADSKVHPERIRSDYEKLGRTVSQLGDLESLNAAMATGIAERDTKIAEYESDLRDCRASNEGLKNQIMELRSSTSWALTRPIRAVSSKLHGRQ
jgi:hypothetical protein